MATVTAMYDDRDQAERAIQALRQRGIPADHIHVTDEEQGGTRITVEVADEGARIVRDMLEENRRPITAQGGAESGSVPEGVVVDETIDDEEQMTAAGVAAGETAGTAGAGGIIAGTGTLGGTALGARVAEELTEQETEPD
ncbi:MAG: hypothetical protein M5U01_08855 [Ardenticatenaceae bacterium]|nr:hypothetical protein [Ardenticatenaceae bacterium]